MKKIQKIRKRLLTKAQTKKTGKTPPKKKNYVEAVYDGSFVLESTCHTSNKKKNKREKKLKKKMNPKKMILKKMNPMYPKMRMLQ
jgi:hypothetical protein